MSIESLYIEHLYIRNQYIKSFLKSQDFFNLSIMHGLLPIQQQNQTSPRSFWQKERDRGGEL